MKISKGLPVVLSVAIMCLSGCGNAAGDRLEPRPTQSAVSVMTAAVETRLMPRSLPVNGSLVADQHAEVAANASGQVTKTFVERGSFVNEGDPIVQLDCSSTRISLKEAEATLGNARAARSNADSQCVRSEDLFKKGIVKIGRASCRERV